MSDVMQSEFRAIFRQKGFVVALVVVALAAVTLNATAQSLGLYFKKEPVALRKDLATMPKMLGPWLQISKDTPLPEEQEHALGTRDYLTREYIDTRAMPGFNLAQWTAQSDDTRRRALTMVMQKSPQSWIRLHMAYYTGMADTVAHVPERCYVAGGYDPDHPQVMTLDPFKGVAGRDPNVKIKYVEFVDRARAQAVRQNVGYFFQVNGAYAWDSITGVRQKLQNIRQKYAYYCKIEMMTQVDDHAEVARQTMSDLMRYALPEIEKCLPDWHEVTGETAELNRGQ